MPQHEIERKFLVRHIPFRLSEFPSSPVCQGYVIVTGNGTELRLRQKGGSYSQTIKRGTGLARIESEITLTENQYNTLWPLTEKKRIVKTRYEILYGDHHIDLDVYHDALEPLMIAEIEFLSVEDSSTFTPPEWFGPEVTEDHRFKNQNLARFGLPEGIPSR